MVNKTGEVKRKGIYLYVPCNILRILASFAAVYICILDPIFFPSDCTTVINLF
jgi:hypothetical protein